MTITRPTRTRSTPAALAFAVLTWTTLFTATSSAQSRPAAAFESADPSMFKEDLSGIPFLVGAYALIWLVLLVYVFLLRRRTDAVVKEVAALRAQIEAATRTAGARSPGSDVPAAPRNTP